MLTYSPCLDIFFKDEPFYERVRKTSRIGYSQFEFWTWWDKDIGAIQAAIDDFPITCRTFCTKFVSLVDRSYRTEYLTGLQQSIETARLLRTPLLISQVGNELAHISRKEQRDTLIDGLKAAAELLEPTGITLVVEPLNVLYDHKGYFLSRTDEAAQIIEAVGSDHIRLLYDIYHQQITEGNLINTITDYLPLISHFHIADHPGRHEIGTGEINYFNVLSSIEELHYTGSVGIELFPLDEAHEYVLQNPLFIGE